MANLCLRTLAGALCTGLARTAAATDKHDYDRVSGPQGGKLLENEAPRAEFFVEKDETVIITFYDSNLKPVPVAGEAVSATAEPKSSKVKRKCVKKGDGLLSKTALPNGDGYSISAQINSTPGGFNKAFRINCNEGKWYVRKRAQHGSPCAH